MSGFTESCCKQNHHSLQSESYLPQRSKGSCCCFFFLWFLQTAYRLLCWMVVLAEAAFSSSTHGWVKPGGELDDNVSRGNCQWTKIARRQGSLGFSSRILKDAKPHSLVLFSKYSPESQLFTSNQCCNSWRLWPLKVQQLLRDKLK